MLIMHIEKSVTSLFTVPSLLPYKEVR